jgi:hypothetical protein
MSGGTFAVLFGVINKAPALFFFALFIWLVFWIFAWNLDWLISQCFFNLFVVSPLWFNFVRFNLFFLFFGYIFLETFLTCIISSTSKNTSFRSSLRNCFVYFVCTRGKEYGDSWIIVSFLSISDPQRKTENEKADPLFRWIWYNQLPLYPLNFRNIESALCQEECWHPHIYFFA